ncbi:hypothetical protein Kpol_1028p68 [Vanderwaltozyma polyspora DSM 70294]|uniref:Cytidyltransferase-like domain-containing protein n=1 Tax=Vanderwaltozyma polyspora (strain ATCC 22028 / DSM 70294 / BCRC 21397 / CBS 2163 / NBRC 10782 / NRRL Y-8283 / UCD 57-17) TaxID=436907 RepID=A7TG36_VANPO|nr:uncharacterized protein Kpol_1028p68 [Vanderwaltozyma polyspora DSM 70294]EDO18793.1 hypothetical protein Kpol_1028p68 [Vanderwaltozyma polyspora DSM 70294]
MARVGVVLKDTKILDYHRVSEIFENCLDSFSCNGPDQLDIVILDEFRSYVHLDETLGKLYNISREVLLTRSLHMLPINIYFESFDSNECHWDILFVSDEKDLSKFHYAEYKLFELPILKNVEVSTKYDGNGDQDKYEVSALGGTFDHIHEGHKILLSIASYLTSSRLIIGVTDQELLVNKKYKEYLENFDERCNNVIAFLKVLKPTLKVEIVPLRDVCGPTGRVPEIQALVVSRETIEGGKVVNKTRLEKGMKELDICVVNVLGGHDEDDWSEKLSSTDLRKIIKETSSA